MDERVAQRRLGERRKVDALAPRAHGLEQLVGRRGDEHDRAASRGLFDGLEELVRRLLVEPVGFEHGDDLVLGLDRGPVRLTDDGLGLGDQDLVALGLELHHVGMHAAQHEVLHRWSWSGATTSAAKQRAASSSPDPRGPTRR